VKATATATLSCTVTTTVLGQCWATLDRTDPGEAREVLLDRRVTQPIISDVRRDPRLVRRDHAFVTQADEGDVLDAKVRLAHRPLPAKASAVTKTPTPTSHVVNVDASTRTLRAGLDALGWRSHASRVRRGAMRRALTPRLTVSPRIRGNDVLSRERHAAGFAHTLAHDVHQFVDVVGADPSASAWMKLACFSLTCALPWRSPLQPAASMSRAACRRVGLRKTLPALARRAGVRAASARSRALAPAPAPRPHAPKAQRRTESPGLREAPRWCDSRAPTAPSTTSHGRRRARP
jgi:hypothetical protein